MRFSIEYRIDNGFLQSVGPFYFTGYSEDYEGMSLADLKNSLEADIRADYERRYKVKYAVPRLLLAGVALVDGEKG